MLKPSSCRILLTFAIVFFEHICFNVHAEKISDMRLCGDRSCQTLLSKARTLARHKPTDPAFLPFERGEMINIYSKSAGTRQDLWGGELNGRRGYFPRSFVREHKVEYQNPQHVVETEHHVPLEERIHGRAERKQVPPNSRTVQHGNRRPDDANQQPDGANQQQTKPVHEDKRDEMSGDKKESDEESKQVTSETVDETEIGDETELPDEEQEIEETETVSPDGTLKPSGMKTESTETENQELEKPSDIENKDPTEVDETEIPEEETEPGRFEDDTETVGTEDEPETLTSKDETETGKTDEQTEIDTDKSQEETERSKTVDETETDETELVDKEEGEIIDKIEEIEKVEVEQQRDGDTGSEDNSEDIAKKHENMDNTEEQQETEKADKREETAETEVDETDKDDEEGSMFGSIWSDESQGKVSESEVIDNINHISHGEHADFIHNPNINTGDHIDNSKQENLDNKDSALHVEKNDVKVESLRNDNFYMHGDGSDERKADENIKKFSKTKSDEQNFTKEGHESQESDSRDSQGIENSDKNVDLVLSEHVDFDQKETKDFKESNTKENLDFEPNTGKQEKTASDKENDNVHHLKDILKSSLPEGDDVHQYLVEHSAVDASESSDKLEGDVYHAEIENDDKDEMKNIETKVIEKSLNGKEKDQGASHVPHKKSEGNARDENKQNDDLTIDYDQELQNRQDTPSGDLLQDTAIKDGYRVSGKENEDVTGTHILIDRDFEEFDNTGTTSVEKTAPITERDVKVTSNSLSEQVSFNASENANEARFNTKERGSDTGVDTSAAKTQDVSENPDLPEKSSSRKNAEGKSEVHVNDADKPQNPLNGNGKTDDSGNIHDDETTLIDRDNEVTADYIDESRKFESGTNKMNIQKDPEDLKEFLPQQIETVDLGEPQNSDKLVKEADVVTEEEATSDKKKLDFQDMEPVKTEDLQVLDTLEMNGAKEDKNKFEDAAEDRTDGAVVGSFQKKEAENEDTKTVDEAVIDKKEEEGENTKIVDEGLTDRKEEDGGKDTRSVEELLQDENPNVEKNIENESSDAILDNEKPSTGNIFDDKTADGQTTEKIVTNDNEIKDENERTKVDKNDEKAEEILDHFEKTIEALADENRGQKDNTFDIEKDDLKFVNDEGETIKDEPNQEQNIPEDKQNEQVYDNNVKEMEQDVEEINVLKQEIGQDSNAHEQGVNTLNENLNKEQQEVDEQKLIKLEKLASGMMSILATPTLSESSTDVPSSVVESHLNVAVTENTEKLDASSSSAPESETEIKVEQIHTPIVVTQTPTGQIGDSSTHEVEADEPIKDDGEGGTVIDGTTFAADYFGEETASDKIQATQQIVTSSMLDNSVFTPAGIVKPTKLFDVPADAEQTLMPPYMEQNMQHDSQSPLDNQQTAQTDANFLENIQATKTEKEEQNTQEIESSDEVSVLHTSFGFATQSTEDTHTLPVDKVGVAVETEVVKNNETVSSDNVQDQVQPSLDQDAYKADIYISRKPLSTEPAPAENTAETDIPGQEVGTEDKLVDEGQAATNQATDENNNEVTQKIVDEGASNKGDWTVFGNEKHVDEPVTPPTTELPEQTEPFTTDEHMFSRKVPDPSLDEEMKQSEDVFMKTLEPFLKSLINMLPPSLQTLLEQEPVGLSPTITMLVSLISTNVLALLTCLGCVCKGKKKPVGRKDPLVVIRDLEEKLFIATKEKENLEDDLQSKNRKVVEIQKELNSQQSTTGTVETDLKTIRLHNEALKKQLSEVQEGLADYKQEVTEKSQVVAYKDSELQTYQAEVQTLTHRAQDAELALQKTSQGLGEREEELRVSLEQVQSLSEQIQQLGTSKQQLQDEAVDWSERVKDLTEQIEQFSADSKRMQEDLAFKENELEVLRDCFLQVKAFQGEEEMKEETEESPDLKEKLKQMMDVSRVNASLRSVEEERDVLQNKLLIEVESRKELEDQVQLLKRKFETNQTDKMKAERQSQEAQTKLEVLSKYFKEKEAELTRQLGEQEVLKNQNITKLQSSDSITQELSKENEVYRQQIEDLKTEITKAERDFRSQIAANEKKAHENWLATRAAERELKESRHECGMLRQKLTDLERKLMQGPPPGLIRPITHRAMPPPGMMNGPPPPPPERPGSRGSVHGHVTPRLREDDYRASPAGPDRMPPPDRRHPPGPMGPRPPPPPLDAMSPPPYAIRPPFPPDRRSPPSFDRYPPPRGPRPPFPRPPPPHLRSPPPVGSIPSEHDDSRQDPVSPYNRAPQGSRDRGPTRHQSQV